MADVSITATDVDLVSGSKETRDAAETITAGQWLYEASSTTVGVATNNDAAKDTVVGIALNGGAADQPIVYAKHNSVVDIGAVATVSEVYLLSTTGSMSPVADKATNDYVSMVAYGMTSNNIRVWLTNMGVQAP